MWAIGDQGLWLEARMISAMIGSRCFLPCSSFWKASRLNWSGTGVQLKYGPS
jgi:hypothetical protein